MKRLLDSKRTLMFAHRGGAGIYPENTLLAFQRSAEIYKADVMELDIHLSKDGEIMVIHDETLNRTTNGTGLVMEKNLAELKKLDAGWSFTSDKGNAYPYRGKGLTIPTLKEVFAAFQTSETGFNIEIKRNYKNIENKLYNLIVGCNLVDRVLVTSGYPAIMRRFDKLNKRGIMTGANALEGIEAFLLSKLNLGALYIPRADALQVPMVYKGSIKVVTDKFVALYKEKGVRIHVWTINNIEDMKDLLEMGVDGIITDYPDRLYELVGDGSPNT